MLKKTKQKKNKKKKTTDLIICFPESHKSLFRQYNIERTNTCVRIVL